MNPPDDARLKQRFEELREQDQRAVPSFAEIVSSPRGGAAPGPGAAPKWVAAALILALGAGITLRLRRPAQTLPQETVALAGWSSPTAFLLETPGRRFFNGIPKLGEPLIRVPVSAEEPSK